MLVTAAGSGMSRLSDLISTFAPDGARSTLSVFPEIDVATISGKLGLAKQGARRGAQDQPGADERELDPVENAAVGEVARLRRIGLEAFENHLSTYARRLDELTVARSEISGIAEMAVADYHALVVGRAPRLFIRARRFVDVERQLAAFRSRNRLEGPAADRMALTLQIGILLILVAIESALNGYFFAQGNTFGLIGGVSVALSVSVVNVGFSWVFGRLATYLNHRHPLRRLFGVVAGLAFLAWMAGLNLFVAHFRDAATGGVPWETALQDSVAAFAADPIGLANFESWILALFGALVSLSSAWKGWSWDDPYPGYGPLYRRRMRIAEDYADELDETLEELQEQRDEACANLDEARRLLLVGIRESADVLTARHGLARQLPEFLAQADHAANHLLSIYRDANRAARSTAAPEHFSQRFAFAPPPKIDRTSDGVDRIAAETRSEIEKVLDGAIERIFSRYKEAIDSFRSMESLDAEAKGEKGGAAS